MNKNNDLITKKFIEDWFGVKIYNEWEYNIDNLSCNQLQRMLLAFHTKQSEKMIDGLKELLEQNDQNYEAST